MKISPIRYFRRDGSLLASPLPMVTHAELTPGVTKTAGAEYAGQGNLDSVLETSRQMTEQLAQAGGAAQAGPVEPSTHSGGQGEQSPTKKQGIKVAGGGWSSCT